MIKVACGIVHHQNKILVTQRSASMRQPYKWEFPGGKIEENESPSECILRELFEELNINVTITGILKEVQYNYPEFEIVLIPFIAVYHSGTITLREHMKYLWLEKDQLKDLDWSPADVLILTQYLN